jgi:hypothetical protein
MKIGILAPVDWDIYSTMRFSLEPLVNGRPPETITLCALDIGTFPNMVRDMCADWKFNFELMPPGITEMISQVDRVLLFHGNNGKWHAIIDTILESGVPLTTEDLSASPLTMGRRRK